MNNSGQQTNHDFIADKALIAGKDDDFQRYAFSARIANTILSRRSSDSIVYGIYGAWGEGKSTVLNFIEMELQKVEGNVLSFTFNPWRFPDENRLLENFFYTFSSHVKQFSKKYASSEHNPKDKKTSKDLLRGWEKFAKIVDQYGLASVGKVLIPEGVSNAMEKATQAFAEVDLEKLHSRLQDILQEINVKIVIFIDDIDRLQKNEVQAIFRLVKLTGNFVNTTYVLSFDHDMVAAAIGERFGSGDKLAGKAFLEKIIQVPLILPKAQRDSLESYCRKYLNEILSSNDIMLSEIDSTNFYKYFRSSILPSIQTPRMAVRYCNAISFYLPLVIGEVNLVDFLLIEGLKIFYPDHYKCVKDNPDYFLGIDTGGSTVKVLVEDDEARELILGNLSNDLSAALNNSVTKLLNYLFPATTSYYRANPHAQRSIIQWKKDKNIRSRYYFQRYFSYTVIDGEISDTEFELLIKDLNDSSAIEQISESIQLMVEKSSHSIFVSKIFDYVELLNWQAGKILSQCLTKMGEKYDNEGSMQLMSVDSTFKKASRVIANILQQNKNEIDLLEYTNYLILNCTHFDFAYEIFAQCQLGPLADEKVFNDEEIVRLMDTLSTRLIDSAGTQTIFKVYPKYLSKFVPWFIKNRRDFFFEYIDGFLNEQPLNDIYFISSFVSLEPVAEGKDPWRSDLTLETMKYMAKLTGHYAMKKRLISLFSEEELNLERPLFFGGLYGPGNTDINLARQFLDLVDKVYP